MLANHTPRPTAALPRLAFLDTLRGVAALAVFVTHILEQLSPEFQHVRFTYFDPGSWGVVVFFLCSGFIIPVSLERHRSLGRFWTQRFFRLFPLYWLSVFAASAYYLLAPAASSPLAYAPAATILANLTMLQLFIGAPLILRVYWTLGFELVFYMLVSILFRLRVRPGVGAALACVAATLGVEVGLPLAFGVAVPPAFVGVYLMMFTGTVLYRYHCGEVGLRAALGTALLGLAALCAAALLNGYLQGDLWHNRYLVTAWALGYVFFLGIFARREHPAVSAAAPRSLGTVSYSLYVLHYLVILAVPATPWPALTALVWLVAGLAVAGLSYRWVERPTMGVGARLGALASRPRPSPASAD